MERSIALILSGGSLRGAAHIGVIRCLEELGLAEKVTFVAGTSAGAIIGSMFAKGYNSIELEEAFRDSATAWTLFDVDYCGLIKGIFTSSKIESIFRGKRIERKLRKYLGVCTFENLPRRLAVVATDINRGYGRIFTDGPVVPAVRASMAIPGMYAPVKINGSKYVDGGVTDYLPLRAMDSLCGYATTQMARGAGCPRISEFSDIIAVNLGYAGKREKDVNGAVQYIIQAIDIQGAALADCILDSYPMATVIKPRIYDVGGFEIGKVGYCIRKGYLAAMSTLT